MRVFVDFLSDGQTVASALLVVAAPRAGDRVNINGASYIVADAPATWTLAITDVGSVWRVAVPVVNA